MGGTRWRVRRLGDEPVADAANGEDQLGVDLVVAEALAQPLHVDGDRVGAGYAAPHAVADLFPGDDPVGVHHQQFEQAQFAHRHPDQGAVEVHLERGRVEPERADLDRWTGFTDPVGPDSPQDGQHLPQPVGVGHTGGRSGGESRGRGRPVTVADADDHGDRGPGGESPDHGRAVEGGQGRGGEHRVGVFGPGQHERLGAVGADDRPHLVFGQLGAEFVRALGVGIGDEQEEGRAATLQRATKGCPHGQDRRHPTYPKRPVM